MPTSARNLSSSSSTSSSSYAPSARYFDAGAPETYDSQKGPWIRHRLSKNKCMRGSQLRVHTQASREAGRGGDGCQGEEGEG